MLVGALNTSDRDARCVTGFQWASLDLQPDADAWRLERSDAEPLAWRSDDADGDETAPTAAALGEAKACACARALVPLMLDAPHHYVDWAHALEEVAEGGRAPPSLSAASAGPCRPSV